MKIIKFAGGGFYYLTLAPFSTTLIFKSSAKSFSQWIEGRAGRTSHSKLQTTEKIGDEEETLKKILANILVPANQLMLAELPMIQCAPAPCPGSR